MYKEQTKFSIRKLFSINKDMIEHNKSFIIDIPGNSTTILSAIAARLQFDDVEFLPPILVFAIQRDVNDHAKIDISDEIEINEKENHYLLFSITAYADSHFAQFFKNSDGSWYGIDDETGFDISPTMVKFLYGWDSTTNPLSNSLKHDWLAYVLYYRKSNYNLSNKY